MFVRRSFFPEVLLGGHPWLPETGDGTGGDMTGGGGAPAGVPAGAGAPGDQGAPSGGEGESGTDDLKELATWLKESGLDMAKAKKNLEHARTWETRAKANAAAAKELEELKKAQMTDQEKVIAEAKTEAFAAAMAEVGGQLVAAKVEALLGGRKDVDVAALLEGRDLSTWMGDDGRPDEAAIAAWLSKVAPAPKGAIDLGAGARGQQGGGGEPSLADQIAAAEKAGEWAKAVSLKSRLLAAQATGQQNN